VGLVASRYFLRMKKQREEEVEAEESLESDEDMEAALDRYETEELRNRSDKEDSDKT
jgi:hypothetical protein